jgi:hypothetical protein
MDIMELGAIGELVGGVAVIATLIYLAVQIRQSTALAQGTAQRDLMNSFQLNLDRIARDPGVWHKGLQEFDTASNEECLRFHLAFAPSVNHLEQALRMLSRGLETQDNIDIYGDICLSWLQEPGGRAVWEHTKPLFFPMSRQYIERRLSDRGSLPPPVSESVPWFASADGPRR